MDLCRAQNKVRINLQPDSKYNRAAIATQPYICSAREEVIEKFMVLE